MTVTCTVNSSEFKVNQQGYISVRIWHRNTHTLTKDGLTATGEELNEKILARLPLN